MIIIEGCDNTGKTTLIHQLQQQFKLPSARTAGNLRDVNDILVWHNWSSACPKQLILDRHPAISDLVYGPIIRNYTATTIDLALAARRDNFLVFCCPPLQTVKSSFDEREQMEGTHERVEQLYNGYQDLMMELEPDAIFDYTNPRSYQALVRNLTSAMGRL